MRATRLYLVVAATILVCSLTPPRAVRAACPESSIGLSCAERVTTTADSLWQWCSGGGASAQGGFALRTGRFSASGSGHQYVNVTASDDYVLEGSAIGSTTRVAVELHARGWVSRSNWGSGYASARLKLVGGSETVRHWSPGTPPEQVLRLEFDAEPGRVFRLEFGLSAGGSHIDSGSIDAWLVFAQLPPGTAIRSCQGFLSEAPVDVLPTTWGSIKARYK